MNRKADFFLLNEPIRITNRIELECSNSHVASPLGWRSEEIASTGSVSYAPVTGGVSYQCIILFNEIQHTKLQKLFNLLNVCYWFWLNV